MRIRKLALIVVGAVALASVVSTAIATAAGRRLVKKPTYDATARVVELFEGIEQKSLEARLIPKLSEKKTEHVGGVEDEPYFSESQIAASRQLVAKFKSEGPVENGE